MLEGNPIYDKLGVGSVPSGESTKVHITLLLPEDKETWQCKPGGTASQNTLFEEDNENSAIRAQGLRSTNAVHGERLATASQRFI